MEQIARVIMVEEKKSKKTYRHAGRFDDEAEKALEDIKKYNREHYIDDEDSPILRSSVKFYRDYLYGRLKKE